MNSFLDIINVPIGWILKWLNIFCNNNFALAIILLTVIANVIVIPLSIHSQKSSAKQARLRPRLDALKKKYGDDKMKYNEAMQQLYTEEGVSMTGGCLPMLMRLPFFIAVYNVVRNPLTYVSGLSADIIKVAKEAVASLEGVKTAAENLTELEVIEHLGDITGKVSADVIDKIGNAASAVNFDLFGINLAEMPKFSINIFGDFKLIWLIPILSFVTAMLSSLVSSKLQKRTNPDTPNMGCIMFGMPVISLVIAFSVPGAVGFYWAISNLVSGIIQVFLQLYCGPGHIIAKEQVKDTLKKYETEQKKINRRDETC